MPKNANFTPKKHSKNSVFTSFFVKKHQKMHFFHPKIGVKTALFAVFGSKLHHSAVHLFGRFPPLEAGRAIQGCAALRYSYLALNPSYP